MRRAIMAGLALGALTFLMGMASATAQEVGPNEEVGVGSPGSCDGKPMRFHHQRAKALLEGAYPVTRYSTHEVADGGDLRAYREHKRCIRVEKVRKKLGAKRHDAAQFAKARIRVTPYPGPGRTFWAIPWYVAACESGGNPVSEQPWSPYYPEVGLTFGGAYGMLVSTWHLYGGGKYADQANHAEPWQQDEIAYVAWVNHGPGGWTCA